MNRTRLVIIDLLWAISLITMVFGTTVFNRQIFLMVLFVVFVSAGCILRHINYYNVTKKIY